MPAEVPTAEATLEVEILVGFEAFAAWLTALDTTAGLVETAGTGEISTVETRAFEDGGDPAGIIDEISAGLFIGAEMTEGAWITVASLEEPEIKPGAEVASLTG